MENIVWSKIKGALSSGRNREAFREEMILAILAGQPFDPQALILKHKLSSAALPIEVRKATIEANSNRWEQLANNHDLNVHQETDRLASLGLGRNFTHSILLEFAQSRIDRIVQEILSDGIVEPAEDAHLQAEANALGVQVPNNAELANARDLWRAANSPLPVIEPPLLLKRGEVCHQACQAAAFEDRTRTVRVNYGGPTARVRLMKGVYYSAGSIRVQSEKEDYSHELGSGILCATNSRLLFVSPQKTISIPLGKIIQCQPYSDGIKVFKDSGKPLTFVFPSVSKIDVLRCMRVIEECR